MHLLKNTRDVYLMYRMLPSSPSSSTNQVRQIDHNDIAIDSMASMLLNNG